MYHMIPSRLNIHAYELTHFSRFSPFMLRRVVPADGRSVKRLRFVPGVGVVSVGMDGRMVIADPERWAEVYVSVYLRITMDYIPSKGLPNFSQISR
jgi:hypothetical protein